MSETSQAVEEVIKKQIVEQEIAKAKNKIRPVVAAVLNTYLDSPAFKKKVMEEVKESIESDLNDNHIENFLPSNFFRNRLEAALKKMFK